MTLQYDQGDINLRDASPISIATPDATPVIITLDRLTGDGQVLEVDMYGGGAAPISAGNPLGVTATNYGVLTGVAVFSREAGVGAVQPGAVAIVSVGVAPVLAFTFVDDPVAGTTTCQLTITGPAFLYNHRLKVSKIRF